MSSEPSGLAGAMSDASGGQMAPTSIFPTVEQLDWVADGNAKGGVGTARLREARRRHERGRPPGARNKRNQKIADWFVTKFGDPLSAMGEIMAMPADALMELMRELQGGDAKHKPLRAIDVLRLKLEAAASAAPYVHGKQPVSVEVSTRKDAVIVIPGLNAPSTDHQNLQNMLERFGLAALDPAFLEQAQAELASDPDALTIDGAWTEKQGGDDAD